MGAIKHRILVVDDERHARELLSAFLVSRGYEVLAAGNAGEALEHIEASEPDLILLDIRLPDASGEKVLEYLRDRERIEEQRRLPVIVISGILTSDLAPRLIKSGADALIVKPFELQRVLKEIERVLDLAPHRAKLEERKREAPGDTFENLTNEDIDRLASKLKEIRAQIDTVGEELKEHPEDEEPMSEDVHTLEDEPERKRLQEEGQALIAGLRKIEEWTQDRIRGLSEDEKKPD